MNFMIHLKTVLVFLLCCYFLPEGRSQGCSDAGACTIDALRPAASSTVMRKSSKLSSGLSFGSADYGITVFGALVGYSARFTEKWSVDARLTFLSQVGNGISAVGPADLFFNVNYQASQKLVFTLGTKIPLTKADRVLEGIPLPMDYQSSLGTLDVIAGVKYTTAKWQWALAAQLPLRQNENAFFPQLYDTSSVLNTIQATNGFQRQADILLHISRPIWMSEKVTFTPGLLPIYHLGEDQFTDVDGIVKNIEGSDGLTLNGTVYIEIKLNDVNTLDFSLGFPFIVRDARPDGLTRSFVFGVGYAAQF